MNDGALALFHAKLLAKTPDSFVYTFVTTLVTPWGNPRGGSARSLGHLLLRQVGNVPFSDLYNPGTSELLIIVF